MTARIDTIAGLRAWLTEVAAGAARRGGAPCAGTVGLVPTMGAIHAGHVKLIETARGECDTVVVSIFVNPLQFDRAEDLATYPRMLDDDLVVCQQQGVDVVFAPSPSEMYPRRPECTVDVGRLADHLCGRFRPGHFRGVATVVLKLLQIVQPHRAYFGEKDAQQLAIIRKMAADFDVPVSIVEVGTVREPDGLALSSRNQRLSHAERRSAAALYRALDHAREMIAGGARDPAAITRAALSAIQSADDLRVEYFEIVDPADMQPVAVITGSVRVMIAAWVGKTRLIDNVLCGL